MGKISTLINTLLCILCFLSVLTCKQYEPKPTNKKKDIIQSNNKVAKASSKVASAEENKKNDQENRLPPPAPPLVIGLKGDGGNEIQEIIVESSSDPPPPVLKRSDVKTAEEAYKLLKDKIIECETKLEDERVKFDDEKYLYGLFYDAISPDFEDPDKRDVVFAALGYDVEVLRALDNVLDVVTSDTDEHNPVLYMLFKNFTEITELTEEVLGDILINENLEAIKTRGMDSILKIYSRLKKFMSERRKLINKMKRQIMLAESSTDIKVIEQRFFEIINYKTEINDKLVAMRNLKFEILNLLHSLK